MANEVAVAFSLAFRSDGVSTSIVVDLSTHPVFFGVPASNAAPFPELSGEFVVSKPAPIAVDGVLISNGTPIISATLSGHVLTISLGTPVTPAAIGFTIIGYLIYS